MTASFLVSALVLLAALVVGTRLVGAYLVGVYGTGPAVGDRVFGPVERLLYRLLGVDPRREQRWTTYALAMLTFSVASIVVLYVLQRVQGALPVNPTGAGAVGATSSFNTAVSFATNTNWQGYAGESTMSHLTQLLGLTVQNFVSAAVGMAVAIAFVRGLTRAKAATLGNFWVDLVRTVVRVLLPLSLVVAVVFVSQGMIDNLHGNTVVTTVEQHVQSIPGGPVASQEAIKEVGTNGGGFFNANAAHPFEGPTGAMSVLQVFLLLVLPFALTYTFGRMAGNVRQGWVVFAGMFVLLLGTTALAVGAEQAGNPKLAAAGVTQATGDGQSGGNLEGKEVRNGAALSGVYAAATTGTSTGSVIAMHDSFTPLGGMAPLINMMLGEVSPGGVGSGLYGMLVFALLAVFIAGLMVGRTPEYLGKKIQATEMKLVVIYILAVPLVVLAFAAASVVMDGALASLANPGAHGLTEVVYAYTSAGNNNGSAFAGLSANTDWYNTTLGVAMLIGRYALMIPLLAIAGSLVRKQRVPVTSGTFPTDTPLFGALLVGVVVIVVGLTYFPVLALGPIVEHLQG